MYGIGTNKALRETCVANRGVESQQFQVSTCWPRAATLLIR